MATGTIKKSNDAMGKIVINIGSGRRWDQICSIIYSQIIAQIGNITAAGGEPIIIDCQGVGTLTGYIFSNGFSVTNVTALYSTLFTVSKMWIDAGVSSGLMRITTNINGSHSFEDLSSQVVPESIRAVAYVI